MSVLRAAVADLPGLVGYDLGATTYRVVDQQEVDTFATMTGDVQWIHVDPVRAADRGGTIVHGLFLLSLLGGVWSELIEVVDAARALNYGLDRVRFLRPVPVGSAICATASVAAVTERPDGVKLSLDVRWYARGEDKPAVVATSLVLFESPALRASRTVLER